MGQLGPDRFIVEQRLPQMAGLLDDLRVRVQLRHPEEGDLLAFTVTAELVDEPAVLRVGADSFEKEMAELEAADQ